MLNVDVIERLNDRTAVIGIVGLGYVGLPLALRFSEQGYEVRGFDINAAKVDRLNRGESFIEHIPSEAIAAALSRGMTATTDFALAGETDAIIICVPTPLTKHREPDLSFVVNTV
jgi:UDP-N-acetyl-D-glucosamine dehydrogenase